VGSLGDGAHSRPRGVLIIGGLEPAHGGLWMTAGLVWPRLRRARRPGRAWSRAP